jgi:hypothetical protein
MRAMQKIEEIMGHDASDISKEVKQTSSQSKNIMKQ